MVRSAPPDRPAPAIDIDWAPLPALSTGGRPALWITRLRPFLDRPGEWGSIRSANAWKLAQYLTEGRYALPEGPGRWEFQARQIDKVPRLYVRYSEPAPNGTPPRRRR